MPGARRHGTRRAPPGSTDPAGPDARFGAGWLEFREALPDDHRPAAPTFDPAPAASTARGLSPGAVGFRDRDPSDPARRAVDLAQRGRIILDVATVDLEAAERLHGPFHEVTWHFRKALDDARNSWDRLRADFGKPALDAALAAPPLVVLTLGDDRDGPPRAVLIVIDGRTYDVARVAGTPLAPVQWRLTRLRPPLDDGPYYACRLADRSTQCDCAAWTYHDAESEAAPDAGAAPVARPAPGPPACKHLSALRALGWI